MPQPLTALKERLAKVARINQAIAVLDWDQQTYMPEGGGAGRAEQIAALTDIAHTLFTDNEVGELLAAAEKDLVGTDADSDDARLLKVVRREYDQETKIPSELVNALARETALGHEVWAKARANNDFASFAPTLERIVELTRQKAEALGYTEHPYDALLDLYEPGLTTAEVTRVFEGIKQPLLSLVGKIAAKPEPDDSIITSAYAIVAQRALTLDVIRKIGFDMGKGRQDEAAHPFCTTFNTGDVRLTTRFDERYLPMGLYGSMHEAGHGLYEQGSPERFEGSPLAGGVSMGVHESQSRMWENLVGRSRPFATWLNPRLKKAFDSFAASPDEYYRAVNIVRPSFIRVEADEVTYNLHILIRFELERDLIGGNAQGK